MKILRNVFHLCTVLGEASYGEGQIIVTIWDGETPYMHFIRAGLEEEKVVSYFSHNII